jgi:hypothetical protein
MQKNHLCQARNFFIFCALLGLPLGERPLSKADIQKGPTDVRFTSKSGHGSARW